MAYIELHIHDDTLETRYCTLKNMDFFRYHAGFTREDDAAGWRQAQAIPAEGLSESDIQAELAKVVDQRKEYWNALVEKGTDQRVVHKGNHFTWHTLGTSEGFGGAVFRVEWLDLSRPPLVCNLSGPGKVPAWIRHKLPDNAAAVTPLDEPEYNVPRLIDFLEELHEVGVEISGHDEMTRRVCVSQAWPAEMARLAREGRKVGVQFHRMASRAVGIGELQAMVGRYGFNHEDGLAFVQNVGPAVEHAR